MGQKKIDHYFLVHAERSLMSISSSPVKYAWLYMEMWNDIGR